MTRNQRALALLLLASINAFGFIDRVMIALVAEKIKELIPGESTSLYVIGPIVGASVGPGTIIVFYCGKHKKEQLNGN